MSDLFLNETWSQEELDEAFLSFTAIQEELNYRQAQNSLRDLLNHLDLTPSERAGLEAEIQHLTAMLDKLDQSVVQIAAFGMVGRGKSSVLNALLGQDAFQVGPLHGVTRSVGTANWALGAGSSDCPVQRAIVSGIGEAQIQLIDTPGIDEVDGKTREALAREVAQQSDLILFVIAGDMTKVEYEALRQLREVGKPMLLAFNKIDQYPTADRQAIYEKIRDERVQQLLSPEEIVLVAAAPLIAEAVRNEAGRVTVQRRRGEPQIADLKLKILEILHREGKSLVALNTMLYADEVNERVVGRKMAIREEGANQLIQRAVLLKAIAVALNPVTIIDLLAGAAVDVATILALSRLYGLPMTQSGAIALLRQIGISMGGIGASEFLASLGLSSLKGLLGISAPATAGASLLPYLSVAVAQGSIAGLTCHAIAQVTKAYLANGASWGEDGPKAVVKGILASLDEQSILNRIKWELEAKLTGNSQFPET
jgi:small GTP-binding protein